jgi:hypothetical protein
VSHGHYLIPERYVTGRTGFRPGQPGFNPATRTAFPLFDWPGFHFDPALLRTFEEQGFGAFTDTADFSENA